jgi:hypothetical protein
MSNTRRKKYWMVELCCLHLQALLNLSHAKMYREHNRSLEKNNAICDIKVKPSSVYKKPNKSLDRWIVISINRDVSGGEIRQVEKNHSLKV